MGESDRDFPDSAGRSETHHRQEQGNMCRPHGASKLMLERVDFKLGT